MAKAGKRKEMVEERTVKNRMSLRCVLHVVSEIVGVRESYVCVCDHVVCDRIACDNVACERVYLTRLCVKDLCACEYVKEFCVCVIMLCDNVA